MIPNIPPKRTSISPDTTCADASQFDLNVFGTDFSIDPEPPPTVTWDGDPLGLISSSQTQLTVVVTEDLLQVSSPRTVTVAVNNPDGGAESTTMQIFGPSIESPDRFDPPAATEATGDFDLIVTGLCFARESRVLWNNQALATTFNSPTQLTAAIPGSLIEQDGQAFVRVENPTGTKTLDKAFTILNDDTPPVITGVDELEINATSATIGWDTNEPADSTVIFETDPQSLDASSTDTQVVAQHSLSLFGLTPNTTYFYKVQSTDLPGNMAESVLRSFDTLDNIVPEITDLIAGSITETTAVITWNTNEPATSKVFFGLDPSTSELPIEDTSPTSIHSIGLSGLTPGATYFFRVESSDDAMPPNTATSGILSFTTEDITAPLISNVVVGSITQSTANVTWQTTEDADSEVLFGISPAEVNQSVVDSVLGTDHSINLIGLNPGTEYFFQVRSKDPSGNVATSQLSNFTTLDNTGPVITVYQCHFRHRDVSNGQLDDRRTRHVQSVFRYGCC